MFGLTDTAVLHTLYQKSRQEIPTKIFYDPKASIYLNPKIKQLQTKPIHTSGLLHQKILIIDNSLVFLGSANLTRTSLDMHDNLVLGLYSPKIAAFLQENTPHYSHGHLQTMVGGQDIDIWLLPDPRGHALQSIRQMLRQSCKNIRIAMFTLTHPVLLEEIIAAHKRGVKVQVVVDYQSGMGASCKAVDLLKKQGITVLFNTGAKLMHHKFLYIDDKDLLLGSANWTKAAFYKNQDVFVILHNVTSPQKAFLKKLWSSLFLESDPRHFVKNL